MAPINDAEIRFRASLDDEVSEKATALEDKLKRLGASESEIRMAVKMQDEATPKLAKIREHLNAMKQRVQLNFQASTDEVMSKFDEIHRKAREPIPIEFIDNLEDTTSRLFSLRSKIYMPMMGSLPGTSALYGVGMGAGIAGAVGGAVSTMKESVDINSQMQQQQMQLTQTLRDSQAASKEMQKVVGYAMTTPYMYQSVLGADVRGRSYQLPMMPGENKKVPGGYLPMAVNMAASMGTNPEDAMQAIAESRQGYYQRLMMYGIKMHASDFSTGGRFAGQSIDEALQVATRRFQGAAEAQMKTMTGAMTNVHDVLQQQVLKPIGGFVFQLANQGVQSTAGRLGQPQFQAQMGEDVQKVQRATVDLYQQIRKGKDYFNVYIKQPLEDVIQAIMHVGKAFAQTFGGTTFTVVKTLADAFLSIVQPLAQISKQIPMLGQLLGIVKAFQMLGMGHMVNPLAELMNPANLVHPLRFMSALARLPATISKISFVLLLSHLIEAHKAANNLNNQFRDAGSHVDDLNAKVDRMALSLGKSATEMKNLTAFAAQGIPETFNNRSINRMQLAPDIARNATELAKYTGGKSTDIVKMIEDQMKKAGDFSEPALRTFSQEIANASDAAKSLGMSMKDMQRIMTEFAPQANKIGLGGIAGTPALMGLMSGLQHVSITPAQTRAGIYNQDELMRQMLSSYAHPAVDEIQRMGPRNVSRYWDFRANPGAVRRYSAQDQEFTREAQTQQAGQDTLHRQMVKLSPAGAIDVSPNVWLSQHLGTDWQKFNQLGTRDPMTHQAQATPQQGQFLAQDWSRTSDNINKATNALTKWQGVVQSTQNDINNLQQMQSKLNLKMEAFQHTTVPLQRAIAGIQLQMSQYQLSTVTPIQRSLDALGQSMATISHNMSDASYSMDKWNQGLQVGEQAALDQLHALDRYNRALQEMQLQYTQIGAELGQTTFDQGARLRVEPLADINLSAQMQRLQRKSQLANLRYQDTYGEGQYQMQQAARSRFQREELPLADRLKHIHSAVTETDNMTAAQHNAEDQQYKLNTQMYHANRHLQDMQNNMQGLQNKLTAIQQSKTMYNFQDQQYKLEQNLGKANTKLFNQQRHLDNWENTVDSLKLKAQDLGNLMSSMFDFSGAKGLGAFREARKIIDESVHAGTLTPQQGKEIKRQLDIADHATRKAQSERAWTSDKASWEGVIANGVKGLYRGDTWTAIGDHIKALGDKLDKHFPGAGVIGHIAGSGPTAAIATLLTTLLTATVLTRIVGAVVRHTLVRGITGIAAPIAEHGLPRLLGDTVGGRAGRGAGRVIRGIGSWSTRTPLRESLREAVGLSGAFRRATGGLIGGAVGGAIAGPPGMFAGGFFGERVANAAPLRDWLRHPVNTFRGSLRGAAETSVEDIKGQANWFRSTGPVSAIEGKLRGAIPEGTSERTAGAADRVRELVTSGATNIKEGGVNILASAGAVKDAAMKQGKTVADDLTGRTQNVKDQAKNILDDKDNRTTALKDEARVTARNVSDEARNITTDARNRAKDLADRVRNTIREKGNVDDIGKAAKQGMNTAKENVKSSGVYKKGTDRFHDASGRTLTAADRVRDAAKRNATNVADEAKNVSKSARGAERLFEGGGRVLRGGGRIASAAAVIEAASQVLAPALDDFKKWVGGLHLPGTGHAPHHTRVPPSKPPSAPGAGPGDESPDHAHEPVGQTTEDAVKDASRQYHSNKSFRRLVDKAISKGEKGMVYAGKFIRFSERALGAAQFLPATMDLYHGHPAKAAMEAARAGSYFVPVLGDLEMANDLANLVDPIHGPARMAPAVHRAFPHNKAKQTAAGGYDQQMPGPLEDVIHGTTFYQWRQQTNEDQSKSIDKQLRDYQNWLQKNLQSELDTHKISKDQYKQYRDDLQTLQKTYGDTSQKMQDDYHTNSLRALTKYYGDTKTATTTGLQDIYKITDTHLRDMHHRLNTAQKAMDPTAAPADTSTSTPDPTATSTTGRPISRMAYGGKIIKGMRDGLGRLYRAGEEDDELVIPTAPHRRERAKSLLDQARGIIGYAQGGYVNPFKDTHVQSERIDMGVDYGGTGPVRAIGDGKVVTVANVPQNAYGGGGGWVTYQLTSGSQKGKYVFLGEHVTPSVRQGQSLKAGDIIARISGGIETGWAAGPGAWNTLAAALGQQNKAGDPGEFPTAAGADFNRFLLSVGAPGGILNGKPTGSMRGAAGAMSASGGAPMLNVHFPHTPQSLKKHGAVGHLMFNVLKDFHKKILSSYQADGSGGPIHIPRGGSAKRIVAEAAKAAGIPAKYLWGIFGAETNFGQNVNTSSAGAQGPFQFEPGTADSWVPGGRKHINNMRYAAVGAAKYLRALYNQFGTWPEAIGHYNSGPGGNLTNHETAAYIPKVLNYAKSYAIGKRKVHNDEEVALLHRGERVLNAAEASKSRRAEEAPGQDDTRRKRVYDAIIEIEDKIQRSWKNLESIDSKTQQKHDVKDLSNLNAELRRNWARVDSAAQSSKDIGKSLQLRGDTTGGEGTLALVRGEQAKFNQAVTTQQKEDPALLAEMKKLSSIAADLQHTAHGPTQTRLATTAQHLARTAVHSAAAANTYATHHKAAVKEIGRSNYLVGAARRGVNSKLITDITGHALSTHKITLKEHGRTIHESAKQAYEKLAKSSPSDKHRAQYAKELKAVLQKGLSTSAKHLEALRKTAHTDASRASSAVAKAAASQVRSLSGIHKATLNTAHQVETGHKVSSKSFSHMISELQKAGPRGKTLAKHLVDVRDAATGSGHMTSTAIKEHSKGSNDRHLAIMALHTKNHGESIKQRADEGNKHRDKLEHIHTSSKDNVKESKKANDKGDERDARQDKRERAFWGSALEHLKAIREKDVTITVSNTATGATISTAIKGGSVKAK